MTRTDERQAMDALLSMDSPFTAAEFAEQLNREQRKDDDPQFVHVDATKADRVLDLMLSRALLSQSTNEANTS